MRTICLRDLKLLDHHAQELAASPILELDLEKAHQAIAIMWDFENWDAIRAAATAGRACNSSTGFVSPAALAADAEHDGSLSPSAEIIRQIGRLVNYMMVFPKLSQNAGTVVPQLYGYDNMEQLTRDHPLQLVEEGTATTAKAQALYESQFSVPPSTKIFAGLNAGGMTLVSGSEPDSPLGFTLDQIGRAGVDRQVRIIISSKLAERISSATLALTWRLESASTLSAGVSLAVDHLADTDNVTLVICLNGFPASSENDSLIREVLEVSRSNPSSHVIFVAGPLSEISNELWEMAHCRTLLAGAIAGYPPKHNPLGLSSTEMNRLVSFTSRSAQDFTYLIKMHDAPARLVYTGTRELPDGQTPQQCSA